MSEPSVALCNGDLISLPCAPQRVRGVVNGKLHSEHRVPEDHLAPWMQRLRVHGTNALARLPAPAWLQIDDVSPAGPSAGAKARCPKVAKVLRDSRSLDYWSLVDSESTLDSIHAELGVPHLRPRPAAPSCSGDRAWIVSRGVVYES